VIANLNMTEKLIELLRKAKIKRDTNLLEEVHNFILDSLQDLKIYKKNNRRSETYQLNEEIRALESLNALVFEINAQIERSYYPRLHNIRKNKRV